jgi:hypothetical protein
MLLLCVNHSLSRFVRSAFFDQAHGRSSVVGLADDPDFVVGFERRAQANPEHRMGIDEENRHTGGMRGMHRVPPKLAATSIGDG